MHATAPSTGVMGEEHKSKKQRTQPRITEEERQQVTMWRLLPLLTCTHQPMAPRAPLAPGPCTNTPTRPKRRLRR